MKLRTVLVVARDAEYRAHLAAALQAGGFEVLQAADRTACAHLLATAKPQAIVADVQATGVISCVPDGAKPPLVTIANRPTAAAMRGLLARSVQVLTKPVDLKELSALVGAAIAHPGQRARTPRSALDGFEPRSRVMLALLQDVERLRDADCPVLILGETGTGKTVLARRIHAIGARPGGNFVDLNCAGLSNDFVESELFGHERGSFTGAHATKQGLLDVAHGGTLFLDEIGDIDLRVQPKVLKVLEEKRFRRLGDVKEREVDVRLLAATHHDLLMNVVEKSFRADLYYRISTIKIVVPPLRERREDIVPLAMDILQQRGFPCELSTNAQERLQEYAWPGNIRELKNVVESSAILNPGQVLTADDLRFDPVSARRLPVVPVVMPAPVTLPPAPASTTPSAVKRRTSPPPLLGAQATDATRAELERAHILLVLTAENGRVESAARRLGIPRSTLYWKLKRYGLKGGPPTRLRAGGA